MALVLVTNPVEGAVKLFAGFKPVEFVFKREDLVISGVESGSGGIKINLTTDLTSYLSAGDSIYVYSEGVDYTYNGVGIILSLTSIDITIDIPFVQTASGGYINYLKNYYVELQCIDRLFASSNIIPFSLNSDGDSAGNITIDVSVVNDLNRQRGIIKDGYISESSKEFEVKYREVSLDVPGTFTIVSNKLIVLLYATEDPESEIILNKFDLPRIYLGYPAAVVIAKTEDSPSSTIELKYKELDINNLEIKSSSLSEIPSDVNGFIMYSWNKDTEVSEATEFIEFEFDSNFVAEYDSNEYDSNDYLTN